LIAARLRALREPRFFGAALWTLASLPAAYAAAALASDLLRRTRYFGSNPINEAEHFLGRWALRLLIATLLVTPLRGLLGWQWLGRHRRALGLLAFGYVVLHWLTYVFLDVQLDWRVLLEDLAKRPFIIIGMAGLLLMLPLALTSSAAAVRRLGGRRWRRLHRLIYVISVLGVVHFWMGVKKDVSDPLLYASLFGVLFLYRVGAWWRARPARSPARPGAAPPTAAAPR
jgi:methionine sulfoxide reductase heme-binding subunit